MKLKFCNSSLCLHVRVGTYYVVLYVWYVLWREPTSSTSCGFVVASYTSAVCPSVWEWFSVLECLSISVFQFLPVSLQGRYNSWTLQVHSFNAPLVFLYFPPWLRGRHRSHSLSSLFEFPRVPSACTGWWLDLLMWMRDVLVRFMVSCMLHEGSAFNACFLSTRHLICVGACFKLYPFGLV